MTREKRNRPGWTELLLCRRPSFVCAGHLVIEREQRFLRQLDRVTDFPLPRSGDEEQLAERVRVHLCGQLPETTA